MVATEVHVETQTVAFDRIPGPEPIVHYIKSMLHQTQPYKCIEQYAFLKILSLTTVQVFVHLCWIAILYIYIYIDIMCALHVVYIKVRYDIQKLFWITIL